MPRPKKDIKIRRDAKTGRVMVKFCGFSRWNMSPHDNEKAAILWANRHRERLIVNARATYCLSDVAQGFFNKASDWTTTERGKGRTFSDHSLQNRAGQVKNYIIPLLGNLDPRTVTAKEIEKAIFSAKKKNGKPLAPATKYKIMDTARVIFDSLCSENIIERNPIENLTPYSKSPIAPRTAIPREYFDILFPPTHGELIRLWGNAMWASMMCFFRDTGLRPGEIRALTWIDLYLDDRIIPIRKGVKAGTSDTIGGTKNDMVKAGIITKRTAQEIAIWRAESKYSAPDQYIFTVSGKAPVTNSAIVKAFRRGFVNAGIKGENWTPYYLRHSFVTYSMDTLDDSELLMLAGHTNIATNMIYRHPDDVTVIRRAQGAKIKLDNLRS